jgi:hypothetical protein
MEKQNAQTNKARQKEKKTRFRAPFVFRNNICNPNKTKLVETIKKIIE